MFKFINNLKGSFRLKVLAWMMLFSGLLLILFATVTYIVVSNYMSQRANIVVNSVVERSEVLLNSHLESLEQGLDLLLDDSDIGNLMASTDKANERLVLKQMYAYIGGRSELLTLHLVSNKEEYSLSTGSTPMMYDPLKFGDWGIFRSAKEKGYDIVYPNVYQKSLKKINAFSFIKPVSHNNDLVGFLILDVSKDYLKEILEPSQNTVYGHIQIILSTNNYIEFYNDNLSGLSSLRDNSKKTTMDLRPSTRRLHYKKHTTQT